MNRLSISGNKVKLPTIGLGTMGFGGYFKRNQEDPKTFAKVIEYAVDCGMSLIDTAEGYAEGGAEEIIAQVVELGFNLLKSPPVRIGFADSPCPTVRCLENEFYPNANDIVLAIDKLFDRQSTDLSDENFYSHEHHFKGPF